jgi:hypothetical protein
MCCSYFITIDSSCILNTKYEINYKLITEIGKDFEITKKFESSQEYGYTTILLLITTYYL